MTPSRIWSSRSSRAARRIAAAIRDGWLVLGVAVLIFVLLELSYRAQAGLRRALRSDASVAETIPAWADSAWFPTYARENDQAFRLRWKPYVYFRRPFFAGTVVNVDSAGRRRTVPGPSPARDTIRIHFFGGSTMWGTDQRDSATIASRTAQRLVGLARPGTTYEVTNFGETGYVFTQEMIELQLQLRRGNVADVVVFYDGINDIASAAQAEEAGIPQNETNRARDFDVGRRLNNAESGASADLKAFGTIGIAMMQRSQLIRRLMAAVSARDQTTPRSNEELAADVAAVYAGNVDIVEALSQKYGFEALYVWQPTLHTTTKRLAPFEKKTLDDLASRPFHRRLGALHKVVLPLLDSAMRSRVGSRFVNESSLFSGDTTWVFTDEIGHNTEKSIDQIVDGFLPRLAELAGVPRVTSRNDNR